MSVFLSFGNCKAFDTHLAEIGAEGMVYLGRLHEEVSWKFEVSVILHHTRKMNFWNSNTVEFVEIFGFESLGNFDGAIASEIEENDAIVILDLTDGLMMIDDDEWGEVLVVLAGIFLVVGGNGLRCRVEVSADA